eukprot:g2850.t1
MWLLIAAISSALLSPVWSACTGCSFGTSGDCKNGRGGCVQKDPRTGACYDTTYLCLSCPLDCSGHGTCDDQTGRCSCENGYVGETCYKPIDCPGNCTGKGICDQRIGRCQCQDGYVGDSCNWTAVPPNMTTQQVVGLVDMPDLLLSWQQPLIPPLSGTIVYTLAMRVGAYIVDLYVGVEKNVTLKLENEIVADFRVNAQSNYGVGPWTPWKRIQAVYRTPSVPLDVRQTSATETSASVSFAAPQFSGLSAVDSFVVQVERQGTFVEAFRGLFTTHVISGEFSVDREWHVRIAAKNGQGLGRFVYLTLKPLTTSLLPEQPSAPTIQSATQYTITLGWIEPNLHGLELQQYILQLEKPAGGWKEVCWTTNTSCVVPLLNNSINRTVTVRLQARTKGGYSLWSSSASLKAPVSACNDCERGSCVDGKCRCEAGWIRNNCSLFAPYQACYQSNTYCIRWLHQTGKLVAEVDFASRGWGSVIVGSGNMSGNGDVWHVWVDDNDGKAYALDRYSRGYDTPSLDSAKQDLLDVQGYQTDSRTIVSFVRAYSTGDSQDFNLNAGPTRIALALNKDTDTFLYHSERVKNLTLDWFPAAPSQVQAAPPATMLYVTFVSQNETRLEWDLIPGATQYQLQRDLVTIYSGNASRVNVSGLKADTLYTFRVRGVGPTGEGAWSAATPTRTSLGQVPTPILRQSAVGPNYIGLAWDEVDFPLDCTYTLLSSQNSKDWQVAYSGPNIFYEQTDLSCNVRYSFTIKASCGTKESAMSAVLSVSTATCSCPNSCSGHGLCGPTGTCACEDDWGGLDCSIQKILPSAPLHLHKVSASPTSLEIEWSAPETKGEPALSSYEVEVKLEDVTFKTTTENRLSLTNLETGVPYTFRVRAVSAFGKGPFSAPTTCETTAAGAACGGCSGFGTCLAGRCLCEVGHLGETCSLSAAFSQCFDAPSPGPSTAFCVHWAHNSDNLTVQIEAFTLGWAGLMLGQGSMDGEQSDCWVVWVDDSTGEAHAEDRVIHGYGTPLLDTKQDLKDVAGYQNATHTIVTFSRAIYTGDGQDEIISGGTGMPAAPLGWALRNADEFLIHTQRGGYQSINFLTSELPSEPQMFRISAKTQTSISFVWEAPESSGKGPIQGYTLEVNGVVVALNILQTTFTAYNLAPGTAYDFRVFAVNVEGAGPASVTLTCVTEGVSTTVAPVSTTITITTSTSVSSLVTTAPATQFTTLTTGTSKQTTGATLATTQPPITYEPDGFITTAAAQSTQPPSGFSTSTSTAASQSSTNAPGTTTQPPSGSSTSTTITATQSSINAPDTTTQPPSGSSTSTTTAASQSSANAPGTTTSTASSSTTKAPETPTATSISTTGRVGTASGSCLNGCGVFGSCVDDRCHCQVGQLSDDCSVKAAFSKCFDSPDGAIANVLCVYWTHSTESVLVQIEAATLGWAGLMIGQSTMGSGQSDGWIVWVDDATGEAHAEDRSIQGYAVPSLDGMQDLTRVAGYQTPTHTIVSFARELKTKDAAGDVEITNGFLDMGWAMHNSIDAFGIHAMEDGGHSMHWLQSKTPVPPQNVIVAFLSADSFVVQWDYPDSTGNLREAPSFVVDGSFTGNAILNGSRSAGISKLQSDTKYSFSVCAQNYFERMCTASQTVKTLAKGEVLLPPAELKAPTVVATGPTSLAVSWIEPELNGSPLIEYELEMSRDEQPLVFQLVYRGLSTTFDVLSLDSEVSYVFRVRAKTLGGSSGSSQLASAQTLAHGECPADCSGHGQCTFGRCVCETGFLGLACDKKASLRSCFGASNEMCFAFAIDQSHFEAELTMTLDQDWGWFGLILGAVDGMIGGDCWVVMQGAELREKAEIGVQKAEIRERAEIGVQTTRIRESTELGATNLVLEDRWSSDFDKPTLDQSQDIVELEAVTNDTHAVVLFRRELKASDSQDIDLHAYINGGDLPLSWAYGKARFLKHKASTRGAAHLNFVSGEVLVGPHVKWQNFTASSLVALTVVGLTLMGACMTAFVDTNASRHLRGRLTLLRLGLTYGQLIMVLAFLVVSAVVFAWSHRNLSAIGEYPVLSWAHLSVYSLVALLMLPTKNSIWGPLLRASHERIVRYHRWVAYFFMASALVHVISMVKQFGTDILLSTDELKHGSGAIYGSAAVGLLIIVTIFSIDYVRRHMWEVFRLTHISALGALVLLYFHFNPLAYYLAVPLLLYVADRILRFVSARCQNRASVESVDVFGESPDLNVTRLTAHVPHFRYQAGQYCYVNIPAISHTQWHPLSISSAPHERLITFHVRKLGSSSSWTSRLAELAVSNRGRLLGGGRVKVDGPYGRISLPLQSYKCIVLVAGGIGITPIASLLNHWSTVKGGIQLKLKGVQSVHVIWTSRERKAFEDWFPGLLKLLAQKTMFNLHLYCTAKTLLQGESESESTVVATKPPSQSAMRATNSQKSLINMSFSMPKRTSSPSKSRLKLTPAVSPIKRKRSTDQRTPLTARSERRSSADYEKKTPLSPHVPEFTDYAHEEDHNPLMEVTLQSQSQRGFSSPPDQWQMQQMHTDSSQNRMASPQDQWPVDTETSLHQHAAALSPPAKQISPAPRSSPVPISPMSVSPVAVSPARSAQPPAPVNDLPASPAPAGETEGKSSEVGAQGAPEMAVVDVTDTSVNYTVNSPQAPHPQPRPQPQLLSQRIVRQERKLQPPRYMQSGVNQSIQEEIESNLESAIGLNQSVRDMTEGKFSMIGAQKALSPQSQLSQSFSRKLPQGRFPMRTKSYMAPAPQADDTLNLSLVPSRRGNNPEDTLALPTLPAAISRGIPPSTPETPSLYPTLYQAQVGKELTDASPMPRAKLMQEDSATSRRMQEDNAAEQIRLHYDDTIDLQDDRPSNRSFSLNNQSFAGNQSMRIRFNRPRQDSHVQASHETSHGGLRIHFGEDASASVAQETPQVEVVNESWIGVGGHQEGRVLHEDDSDDDLEEAPPPPPPPPPPPSPPAPLIPQHERTSSQPANPRITHILNTSTVSPYDINSTEFTIHSGRPDFHAIFSSLGAAKCLQCGESIKLGEKSCVECKAPMWTSIFTSKDVCVFICGPEKMKQDVLSESLAKGFHVHQEAFFL